MAVIWRDVLAESLAKARTALGDAEFERLAAKGAAMPFLDLVRYAETEIRSVMAEFGSVGA